MIEALVNKFGIIDSENSLAIMLSTVSKTFTHSDIVYTMPRMKDEITI